MKSTFLVAAITASLPLSLGQTTTAETTNGQSSITSVATGSSSSTTHAPTTYTVSVGRNHDYSPDTVTALPGDTVIPYDYVIENGDTFFSGPKVSTIDAERPEWLLPINDTEPYFFYCSAPGSCINAHMVGVINPNDTMTLDAQKAALADVKFQLSPGEEFPAEYTPSTSAGSSPTSTSTGSSSTSTGSNESGSGGTHLSGGAIAGIAIGAAAVLIIAIALIWFCGRKGGIEKGYRKSTVGNPTAPAMVEANYGHQPPTSPPPPTYRDSPYGQHSEAYRSTSPAQWSQTGSPHNSYAGYPSPGFASPWSDAHGAKTEPQKEVQPAPVELVGDHSHPGSPPPGRHEFPA
ncbi:hypothetical protein TruAng_001425 [Truncatella angustata]|nr:hypothetical protein TruAng_001425 [Truncatella angustata]